MNESEWQDFVVFDINEEGERTKINVKKEDLGDYLHPEQVFAIIKQDVYRIYLWKGVRSAVRKRFLGSRVATTIQGELMKAGYKRCKIVAIEQGDEVEEFLNVFGLESMKVKEEDKLEDKHYIRSSEREKERIAKILETKQIDTKTSKLVEIKKLLDDDEKIIWFKRSTEKFTENWKK